MPALMRPNPVRANPQAGGNVCGTMAFEFFSPGLMAMLAEAEADFVLLDTEHIGVGIETIKAQLRGLGIVPMVRVPGCDYHDRSGARRRRDGYADGGDRSSGAADRVLVPIPPARRARGRVRHAPRRLRRWRCGAKAALRAGARCPALRLVHSAGVARIALLIGRVRRLSRSSRHGGAPGERQDDEERAKASRSVHQSSRPANPSA
jgi:hypothetical protein